MKRILTMGIALGMLLGLMVPAEATLIDNGGGLIYDTDFNITWLKDANYAKTSGFSATGEMDWTTANTWAASLTYDGQTGWRLPTTLQPDSTCSGQSVFGSGALNCTGSEMGHLWYTELGNTAGSFTNSGPFTDVQPAIYWSGTEVAPHPAAVWVFRVSDGYQDIFCKDCPLYAWAVHPGDLGVAPSSVPEPGTLLLLGSGLIGLVAFRKKLGGALAIR